MLSKIKVLTVYPFTQLCQLGIGQALDNGVGTKHEFVLRVAGCRGNKSVLAGAIPILNQRNNRESEFHETCASLRHTRTIIDSVCEIVSMPQSELPGSVQ